MTTAGPRKGSRTRAGSFASSSAGLRGGGGLPCGRGLPTIRRRTGAPLFGLVLAGVLAATGCAGGEVLLPNAGLESKDPWQAPGQTVYVTYDPLGSTVLVHGDDGRVLGEREWTPFGRAIASGPPTQEQVVLPPGVDRYASGRVFAELDVVHLGARLYAPELGRFTTSDPLYSEGTDLVASHPDQSNPFAYAGGNPIDRNDPEGTVAPLVIAAGIAAGAAIGAAAEVVHQLTDPNRKPGDGLDYAKISTSAAAGGLGVAAGMIPSVGGVMVASFAVGAGHSVVSDRLDGKDVDFYRAARNGALSGAIGGAARAATLIPGIKTPVEWPTKSGMMGDLGSSLAESTATTAMDATEDHFSPRRSP